MRDLRLKDVSFSYPGGFLAVDGINMEIKAGDNVAIVGQNGAGKTTTVKMMNGLLRPTGGDVLIGEMNTKDYTTAQISRIVGYVFQNPDDQIFHATVESEVRFGPKTLKLTREEEDRRVEEALALTGMDRFKDENPLNLPLSTRKFVTIAAVIAMGTDILIGKGDVKAALRQQGVGGAWHPRRHHQHRGCGGRDFEQVTLCRKTIN